jgi:hypothetical protein
MLNRERQRVASSSKANRMIAFDLVLKPLRSQGRPRSRPLGNSRRNVRNSSSTLTSLPPRTEVDKIIAGRQVRHRERRDVLDALTFPRFAVIFAITQSAAFAPNAPPNVTVQAVCVVPTTRPTVSFDPVCNAPSPQDDTTGTAPPLPGIRCDARRFTRNADSSEVVSCARAVSAAPTPSPSDSPIASHRLRVTIRSFSFQRHPSDAFHPPRLAQPGSPLSPARVPRRIGAPRAPVLLSCCWRALASPEAFAPGFRLHLASVFAQAICWR